MSNLKKLEDKIEELNSLSKHEDCEYVEYKRNDIKEEIVFIIADIYKEGNLNKIEWNKIPQELQFLNTTVEIDNDKISEVPTFDPKDAKYLG
jgi:hypothetical protein